MRQLLAAPRCSALVIISLASELVGAILGSLTKLLCLATKCSGNAQTCLGATNCGNCTLLHEMVRSAAGAGPPGSATHQLERISRQSVWNCAPPVGPRVDDDSLLPPWQDLKWMEAADRNHLVLHLSLCAFGVISVRLLVVARCTEGFGWLADQRAYIWTLCFRPTEPCCPWCPSCGLCVCVRYVWSPILLKSAVPIIRCDRSGHEVCIPLGPFPTVVPLRCLWNG